MVKVTEIDVDDLPDEYRYLLEKDSNEEVNLFTALGNNPSILQSYMRMGSTLWKETGLERKEVEIVILSVARQLKARYEWNQHVDTAIDAGVAKDTILSIGRDNKDQLPLRDKMLVDFTIAVLDREVDQIPDKRIRSEFDDKTIVGITMLVNYYILTAFVIESLKIELETEFIGWDLHNLQS